MVEVEPRADMSRLARNFLIGQQVGLGGQD
jgi:hypothetical protein